MRFGRRGRAVLAAAAAVVLLAGCTDEPSSPDVPPDVGSAAPVLVRDPTEPIIVVAGTQVSIALTDVPGAVWTVIVPDSETVVRPANAGSPPTTVTGAELFALRAAEAGTATLTFTAVSPDGSVVEERPVTIVVE